MVDLSACEAPASHGSVVRTWPWIDPEDFYLIRCAAHMSRFECACELGVSVRTIRNWESGFTCIPYSAFKLMRILSGWELPWPAWEGFSVRGDVLWTPEGKPLYAWEMRWLSLTFSMARYWMADRGITERAGVPASSYRHTLEPSQARPRRRAAAERSKPAAQDRGSVGPLPSVRIAPALAGAPAMPAPCSVHDQGAVVVHGRIPALPFPAPARGPEP